MRDKYFRFVSLRLRDYKIFRGVNDFRFNCHRTIVVGKNGIGKTTIADALEHLGPSRGLGLTFKSKGHSSPYVAVITEGNCDLLKKYRSLIFVSCESAMRWAEQGREAGLKHFLKDNELKTTRCEARVIFHTIICRKPWKTELYRDLNPVIMAGGEKVCFGYSLIFALRKILKLDIPIVLDSPYGMLDQELRIGLRDFLKAQPCQQILLGHGSEFEEKEKPKYILVYAEDYSHVMEY